MPVINTEVKLSDESEILIKGPQVMVGYYKNETRCIRKISLVSGGTSPSRMRSWLHPGGRPAQDPTGTSLPPTSYRKPLISLSSRFRVYLATHSYMNPGLPPPVQFAGSIFLYVHCGVSDPQCFMVVPFQQTAVLPTNEALQSSAFGAAEPTLRG